MKRIALSTAAAIALIGSAGIASAYDHNIYRHHGTNTPRIDATEAEQAREIEVARRRGQLSWREYFGLKREQANIERMEAQAKRDGVVTWRERAEIREAQRNAQKHIDEAESNREHARRRWGGWYR
ncbi:MAG: hypothetical protein F9K44_02050 [Hyphomicrobiaceae bacterium]|nr:MAG: hypothetical protein F9K44_02050 [Hyphomicrobiaceae bacterium]